MLRNPHHVDDDPEMVRALIREFPWAIIVSTHDGAMVASHYPVLLDEESEDLAVVTHVGRPDDKNHGFDGSEVLLIIQGRHGYISPSWYEPGTTPAPTWNFSVVHAYGVPEIVDPDENFRVLTRLVAHFEQHVADPLWLDQEVGARIARGTVGIRLPITRFVCKVKMSQDKDQRSREQVLDALRGSGPYSNPALAAEMQRALSAASP